MGKALHFPRIDEPKEADVNKWHAIYMQARASATSYHVAASGLRVATRRSTVALGSVSCDRGGSRRHRRSPP